jgi:hypothetical protein
LGSSTVCSRIDLVAHHPQRLGADVLQVLVVEQHRQLQVGLAPAARRRRLHVEQLADVVRQACAREGAAVRSGLRNADRPLRPPR